MTLRIDDAQAIEFTADGRTLLVASTSGPFTKRGALIHAPGRSQPRTSAVP
jgi:hypothetical protein